MAQLLFVESGNAVERWYWNDLVQRKLRLDAKDIEQIEKGCMLIKGKTTYMLKEDESGRDKAGSD